MNPLYNVKGQKLDDGFTETDADVLVEKDRARSRSSGKQRRTVFAPFRFESLIRWKGNIFGNLIEHETGNLPEGELSG